MSSSSETPTKADWLRVAIVTSGGLGLAKFAPGTWGTLGGVALAVPLAYVGGLPYWLWLACAVALLFGLGVALGGWAERFFATKDPGAVVIDEVAGYLVTVAVFAALHGRLLTWQGHCVAFVLFRIADILKPPPGRACERLAGGVGVMLDDIVLALYSGGALAILGLLGFTWL